MERPPAAKLLFHLASRLEGKTEDWRTGTNEAGYVCAKLRGALADVPLTWAEGGCLMCTKRFHLCAVYHKPKV